MGVFQVPTASEPEQEAEKGLSSNPNLVMGMVLFDIAVDSYCVCVYVGHLLTVNWIYTDQREGGTY